jgi:hypothetical protein
MSFTLNIFEVRGLKASNEHIYVKIKWKSSSSHQEEIKSKELIASNSVFDPPFTQNLGAIDSGSRISFAVKESATLIPKTLGSAERSVAELLDTQSGRTVVTMPGGVSVTCALSAPVEFRGRALSSSQLGPALSGSQLHGHGLFDTEDSVSAPSKIGFSAIAGHRLICFTRVQS